MVVLIWVDKESDSSEFSLKVLSFFTLPNKNKYTQKNLNYNVIWIIFSGNIKNL